MMLGAQDRHTQRQCSRQVEVILSSVGKPLRRNGKIRLHLGDPLRLVNELKMRMSQGARTTTHVRIL